MAGVASQAVTAVTDGSIQRIDSDWGMGRKTEMKNAVYLMAVECGAIAGIPSHRGGTTLHAFQRESDARERAGDFRIAGHMAEFIVKSCNHSPYFGMDGRSAPQDEATR